MCTTSWRSERASQPMGLELQIVVSCPVGAGGLNSGPLKKQQMLFTAEKKALQTWSQTLYSPASAYQLQES